MFVIVPLAFVDGMVSCWPTMNGLVATTVIVAVLDWSPVTVVWRGGQVAASRTTQDFGWFSTPLSWPDRYLREPAVDHRVRRGAAVAALVEVELVRHVLRLQGVVELRRVLVMTLKSLSPWASSAAAWTFWTSFM